MFSLQKSEKVCVLFLEVGSAGPVGLRKSWEQLDSPGD